LPEIYFQFVAINFTYTAALAYSFFPANPYCDYFGAAASAGDEIWLSGEFYIHNEFTNVPMWDTRIFAAFFVYIIQAVILSLINILSLSSL
jgi:hypothetical protein